MVINVYLRNVKCENPSRREIVNLNSRISTRTRAEEIQSNVKRFGKPATTENSLRSRTVLRSDASSKVQKQRATSSIGVRSSSIITRKTSDGARTKSVVERKTQTLERTESNHVKVTDKSFVSINNETSSIESNNTADSAIKPNTIANITETSKESIMESSTTTPISKKSTSAAKARTSNAGRTTAEGTTCISKKYGFNVTNATTTIASAAKKTIAPENTTHKTSTAPKETSSSKFTIAPRVTRTIARTTTTAHTTTAATAATTPSGPRERTKSLSERTAAGRGMPIKADKNTTTRAKSFVVPSKTANTSKTECNKTNRRQSKLVPPSDKIPKYTKNKESSQIRLMENYEDVDEVQLLEQLKQEFEYLLNVIAVKGEERKRYFDTLQQIETACQEYECDCKMAPFIERIYSVLYNVQDGFAIPEEKDDKNNTENKLESDP